MSAHTLQAIAVCYATIGNPDRERVNPRGCKETQAQARCCKLWRQGVCRVTVLERADAPAAPGDSPPSTWPLLCVRRATRRPKCGRKPGARDAVSAIVKSVAANPEAPSSQRINRLRKKENRERDLSARDRSRHSRSRARPSAWSLVVALEGQSRIFSCRLALHVGRTKGAANTHRTNLRKAKDVAAKIVSPMALCQDNSQCSPRRALWVVWASRAG